MKKIQMLAAAGMLFALISATRAEDFTKPAAITVVNIKGQARYSTDGKNWHPLVVGKILHSGAVIETATGSTADLVLSGTPVPVPQTSPNPQSLPLITIAPDPNVRGYMAYAPMAQQNVIRMASGTVLAIDQLTVINTGADTVGNTEVDLRAGRIFFSVKKLSASSQYIIKLPNGVAGIRGAVGDGGADGSFDMLKGQAVVSEMGSDGASHVSVVNGGQGLNPKNGQVEPLSASELGTLSGFMSSAQTLFDQISLFARDISKCGLTPTEGNNGQGQNNNNQVH
jgi:FecR protein